MLHVLLTVLKILLWIVLGILGLALLLLLIVLFAPIRYSADVDYHKVAKVKAKIKFLIVSVTVNFDQEQKKLDNVIRILGIPLKTGAKKNKKPKKNKTEESNAEIDLNESDEHIDADPDVAGGGIVLSEKSEETDTVMDDNTPDNREDNDKFDLFGDDSDIPNDEKKFFGRVKVLFGRIWDKIVSVKNFFVKLNPDNISEAIDNKTRDIKRTIHRFDIFWNLKCTVKTRAYLKKYLVSILRHIAPNSIYGNIHFGFDEPYTTGRVIGYLSMLPFSYQKGLYWEPDFYNKIVECDLKLKGKIRIGYIARIVLNINIWRTLKAAKKIKA